MDILKIVGSLVILIILMWLWIAFWGSRHDRNQEDLPPEFRDHNRYS